MECDCNATDDVVLCCNYKNSTNLYWMSIRPITGFIVSNLHSDLVGVSECPHTECRLPTKDEYLLYEETQRCLGIK